MGGSLFKVGRLPAMQFELLWEGLRVRLSHILLCEFTLIPYYKDKPDFGDMDILVREHLDIVRPLIIENFMLSPDQYHCNDGNMSFVYENFQVDLICEKNHYDMSFCYYSYNDMGNLLGRIYHKLGLKFGHKGLHYPLRDDRGHVRCDVEVSTDMNRTLDFIGLSYSRWQGGFDSLEDIFNYVSSSKYFDVGAYSGEFSAINKKRDAKRTTFSKFIKWVESTGQESKYVFKSREMRWEMVPEIEAYFGVDIVSKRKELDERMELESKARDLFNGEIVMKYIPISGAKLGSFIALFKKSCLEMELGSVWTDVHDKFFIEFLLRSSPGDIETRIRLLYKKVQNYLDSLD